MVGCLHSIVTKMRFSIVLLCILVALLAIAVGRIYQKLFNVPVPVDFPKNSTWQFKIVGFSFGLAKDLVSFTILEKVGLQKEDILQFVMQLNHTKLLFLRVESLCCKV